MMPPKVNADHIRLAPLLKCQCGCLDWESVYRLKHLNVLISPTGREEIVPVPVFRCANCKKALGEKEEKKR